ncbi:hypothetical protein [Pyxidicoccus caerfyrddinensis]|jgi:hypothetical protein|uniref:hypothetical protein n=1 Tax=Pyxidicoccus caerfyrddinensis TaxID=2709663 RepID=UPI0019682F77|nr:hypothetical protein [Pyxidicoccus caerfyrddinensis]
MVQHDDTTYMDDEGLPYADRKDEGESEGGPQADGSAGNRWGYGEEAWGGWHAAE